jgi:hypothetical protein
MPAHSIGVFLAGRPLGCRNFRKFEPRVIGEQLHKALADHSGRSENARAKLLLERLRRNN